MIDSFGDLDAYVRLPRLAGLWLSPDGRRLVVGVGTPDKKNARYATALWEVDPDGERPARQLTRSVKGEAAAAFTPEGDLLFTSARPGPDGEDDDEPSAALWLQPAAGGDARVLAKPAGGLHGVVVSASGTVVAGSGLLPSSDGLDADTEARKRRKEAGVSAILHEEYPVRRWDHDLGPDRPRLLTGDLAGGGELELRDLTGHAGRAVETEDASWDLTPDGRTLVVTWAEAERFGSQRTIVAAVDLATGERRTLAGDPANDYGEPQVSPDGRSVAIVVQRRSSADDPGDVWLAVVPVDGGPVRDLTVGWDRWPGGARWTPDGAALIVQADHEGRSPLWRVDVASGEVTRLTPDDGAYSDVRVSPDGRWVYALRSAVDSPPSPVRVAADGSGGVSGLSGPAEAVTVPGKLVEVTATAADGTPLRAWLALPHGETPSPLLLWIHGGPLGSWNAWMWRWNPWIMVAQGYAVLLPDPALSVGYGYEFVKRGWGSWGDAPYTDLMALTDAAEQRPEIDASRTAAMGGSFGGYMANWVAGHTDRFAAIVTHASLWDLGQMMTTTDAPFYWLRELTTERLADNSPNRFADAITTPMLVIHGDRDYRVPIGEALRLWWDLLSRSKADDGTSPHKFLYFPDENHWILKPGNAKVWYETVLAFLAHHVRGEEWQRPTLLG
ncbi:dipeptidyl aminopeptidase/acylaminoacyl peptidase [Actinoplanes tereljensis]|uniref:Peptidase S9 n=1 Tax=Paractinoplanes tereljensis TaxID=571912 RepID=A0A919NNI5_9ACTN|nr:prolyl oligopeptidase family serine peptidase [Actinoplanes tereljensis]GIF21773.1 peptidase S9 [Actinoplanes tereljensis]